MKRDYLLYLCALKFFVATATAVYITVYLGIDRFPLMQDQDLYLGDIDMIQNNISTAFADSAYYYSNNTLYSRVLGFIAWLIPFDQSPVIIAIYVNALCHFLNVVVVCQIATRMGLERIPLLGLLFALSPTITVYSMFALRDVLITLATSMFFLYAFRLNPMRGALTCAATFSLRPFFMLVFVFVALARGLLLWIDRSRLKAVAIVTSIAILCVAAYVFDRFLSPVEFSTFAQSRFDPIRLVVATLGLESVLTSAEGAGASRETIRGARLIMVDSVVLPASLLVVLAYAIRYRRGDIVQLALTTLAGMFFVAYVYLAITDRFAFRKLMPFLPIIYVLVFAMVDDFLRRRRQRRKRGRTSSANRTLRRPRTA